MVEKKTVNGVNVKELFATIDAIKANPDIAGFRFRATNKWINGTHNRATVKDFYGALKEDNSRHSMLFELDEPPVLLGKNEGGQSCGISSDCSFRMSHDKPHSPRLCQGDRDKESGIQVRR